jgi:hypothetical protein
MSNTHGNGAGGHHPPIQGGPNNPSGREVGIFTFRAFCTGLGWAAGAAIGGPAIGAIVAILIGGSDGGTDDGGPPVS